MQDEELRSYDFDFVGGFDNRYNFVTTNHISYNVRFKPSADYVPLDKVWRDEFYELVIEITAAPDLAHIPADRSILPTIVAIISNFFTVHERVILYICDDSDSRELARKRKFDGWYARFGQQLFEKYDLPAVANGTEQYVASVFFLRDNPYRFAIINLFENLASGEK
ncbi:DUF6169 family protein [Spirosoma gilvum]